MEIVSLVEKGWAGARQITMSAVQAGHDVQHFVRGRLSHVLLEALTPYPRMRIRGYSPSWYRVAVWGALVRRTLTLSAPIVLVDNERAMRWVAQWFPWWRSRVIMVREPPDGPLLLTIAGQPIDRQQWLALLVS